MVIIDALNTKMHDRSLSVIDTDTSIKWGGVKLSV